MYSHRAGHRCRQAEAAIVLVEALESRTLMSANFLGKGGLSHHHAGQAVVQHSKTPAPMPVTIAAPVVSVPVVISDPGLITDPVDMPTAIGDPGTTEATSVSDAVSTSTSNTTGDTSSTAAGPALPPEVVQALPLAPSASAAANGGPVYADPRADINGDGVVDILDYTIVAINWQRTGTPGTLVGDVNGDGVVDILDATIVASNWQLPVAPPVQTPPPVQYDWHQQNIAGVVNVWVPNPSDFGATFTVTDPNALFGSDGVPQMQSIHQGGTADCYLLAAEGAIALEHPGKIGSIVQNDTAGGWEVTFQSYNSVTRSYVPVVIHTDDELSSTWQTEENGEVWNLVIEKAYAAFRTWNGTTSINTMASLNWGFAGAAMAALGEPAMSVFLSTNLQTVYNLIQTDLAEHLPIAMHTAAAAPTMVQSHVYIITGVSTDASGTLWVTTYNPWGFYDTRTVADLLANSVGSLVVGTV